MFAQVTKPAASAKRARATQSNGVGAGDPTNAVAAAGGAGDMTAKRARLSKTEAKEPEELPTSVLVQFQAQGSESPSMAAMDIPTDATVPQLELLINQLLGTSDEPLPYAFYINDTEVVTSVADTITTLGLSFESIHTIRYQPLSIFRVKPATRCTDTLSGHEQAILHISFSPDGAVLASGGGDKIVRFWDASTCMPTHVCEGHTNHVLATAWAPDGKKFASADKNGEVRIWNPKNGKELCRPLTGHAAWVTSLAWEPHHSSGGNVELLASASKDKTVRVWNTRTGLLQFTLAGHSDSVECVRWGGENLIYTASRDKTIMVWAVEPDKLRAKLVRTLLGHAHRINCLALNTDYICRTGAFDEKGNVYATDKDAYEGAVERYKNLYARMGGKELLVSCSDDFTLFLWDPTDNKKPIARMTGHQDIVNQLAFSPDGRYIASASFDKKVKIWEGRSGKFLTNLVGHVARVYQVVWSADSRYIISASKDSTVKVWSAKSIATTRPKAVESLAGHFDEVYALDWSPNGEMVASGSKDRTIKM